MSAFVSIIFSTSFKDYRLLICTKIFSCVHLRAYKILGIILGCYQFNNMDLLDIWQRESGNKEKVAAVFDHIMKNIKESDLSDSYISQIREKARVFCTHVLSRWQSVTRNIETFKRKYADWLKSDMIIEKYDPTTPSTSSFGRPRLRFESKSTRSKRKEAAELSEEKENQAPLMMEAARMAARKKGQTDLAAVLKEAAKSPTRPSKMRKVFSSPVRSPVPYTPEEALAFILENNFSKQQYVNIRLGSKARNCDIYPSYEDILKSKSNCRVDELIVTETTAKVPLNNLLQHTSKRIVKLQEELISSVMVSKSINSMNAELICSYGFDGSSGQSNYKQKFSEPGTSQDQDSSLLATTLIPLRLTTADGVVLWNNQTPQSIRFCRPLKLQYIRETKEQILEQKSELEKEINELETLKMEMSENRILNIQFKLYLTLIDGKVLNILTNTRSAQTCPICAATPADFMQIKDFKSKKFEPKPNTLQFGISPLHCWIRFFECILHISYRTEIQQWQIRSDDNKKKLHERKNKVQQLFWENMGLHVDKPKIGGSGNTNDGNTSRRAFCQEKIFAQITNVDVNLIYNFKIILIALSCQYPLNMDKFENFCFETAKLFMEKYPWYPMPATVHKVLIHSKQIIENSVLPLGYFGEDAAESRNKFYKQDRLLHARKNSRINNLTDMFNRAMDTSDPLISSIGLKTRMQRRQHLPLPSALVSLLSEVQLVPSPSTSSEQEATTTAATDKDSSFTIDFDLLDNLVLENE